MTMNEYQDAAQITAQYPLTYVLDRQFDLIYNTIGLAGEVGEFCNKVKKVIRDNYGRLTPEMVEDLSGEAGDILWYLSDIVTKLGLDLDTVAQKNINKLASRKSRNVLSGSGDNR